MGSAAYDLANVASGALDGYWELNLSIWDVAAGALLVEGSRRQSGLPAQKTRGFTGGWQSGHV